MRTAGTARLTFRYSLPSGPMCGTGVASPAVEPGYLVLDDVRLDTGEEIGRLWIPLPLDGLLFARELPDDVVDAEVYLDAGSPQPDPGSWVKDRNGRRWQLDGRGIWKINGRLSALEWPDLVAGHGPLIEIDGIEG